MTLARVNKSLSGNAHIEPGKSGRSRPQDALLEYCRRRGDGVDVVGTRCAGHDQHGSCRSNTQLDILGQFAHLNPDRYPLRQSDPLERWLHNRKQIGAAASVLC